MKRKIFSLFYEDVVHFKSKEKKTKVFFTREYIHLGESPADF